MDLRGFVVLALSALYEDERTARYFVSAMEVHDIYYVWQLVYLTQEDWDKLEIPMGARAALQNGLYHHDWK